MKRELWVVIIVVGLFIGLIVGYSIPPMLEVGMIGGDKDKLGINTEIETDLESHYQQLNENENENENEK